MRIAAWSGPRNLSTAMMYAFGARNDCAIWDEPFYAAYLAETGLDHPLRDEILAAGTRAASDVIRRCIGPVADGKKVFYQKHMAQHMIEEIPRDWIGSCTNIFLIRDPRRVIASYAAKRENPTLDDIGSRQQAEIFDAVCQDLGHAPPVLDSGSIRADPERLLRKLCAAIGLDFQQTMLDWPAGGHPDDGVWARHWYGAVHKSTGFSDPEGPLPEIPRHLEAVYDTARPFYEKLLKFAL